MKIQTTIVYRKVDNALKKGYTTISAQGSSRSSKTYNICIFLIVYLLSHPNTSCSIVRATVPAIKGSVLRDVKEILIKMGIWHEQMLNKSELVLTFDNGSFIEFFSTDNEQKIRGRKRHVLYVNEANEIDFISWQQLKMRTTLFTIIDYNPSFTDEHWINTINKEEKTYHFITTYKDNPFLEQTIIDELESLKTKNESLWRIYGLGLRAVVQGLVFPNINIIDEIPNYAKRYRWLGMDLGYSSDPTSIVDVCISGDSMYIDEVCYNTKMGYNDIINTIKDWEKKEKRKFEVISESADPRLIDEVYAGGINVKPVHKYAGSIKAGIMKMQGMNIYVTKRSTNVKKEFDNYVYKQDKEGKFLDEPIDKWNHCFTGDTMIETDCGEKKIVDIVRGDMVATSNGYRAVRNTFDNGEREIIHATLCFDGFSIEIKATPEHKIKTEKGWKRLEDIQSGDVIYVSKKTKSEKIWNIKNLTEKYTTGIKGKDISQGAEIDSIGSFGLSIMDVYRKVIMYIIKMVTRPITRLKISNYLNVANIYEIILSRTSRTKKILKKLVRTWLRLPNAQKNGIVQKMGENGTQNMVKRSLKISSPSSSCASNVENISLKNPLDVTSFAQTNANQNGEEIAISTTKQGYANNAGVNLSQTNTAVDVFAEKCAVLNIIIRKKGIEHVYDIEVDDMHEYFANGILAHNCVDAIRYVILEKVLGGFKKGLSASQIAGIL